MKVEYINPFLIATKNLFETLFHIDLTVEKPFLLDSVNSKRWDISAEMVFSGNIKGALALRITKTLSNKLLKLSQVKYDSEFERGELLNEMVKEFVNIIAGNASTQLENQNIGVSIPFIVQGPGHEIPWPKKLPTICVPYNTQYGPFAIIVCMQNNK